jgi:hypothetical protein
MRDDCRWRVGCDPPRAESEADRPSRTLGGRLGMGGPACWVVVDGLGNQLMCDGRLWRPSDGVSLPVSASRNVLRDCARRFKDGARSTSMREAAGKKLAMS